MITSIRRYGESSGKKAPGASADRRRRSRERRVEGRVDGTDEESTEDSPSSPEDVAHSLPPPHPLDPNAPSFRDSFPLPSTTTTAARRPFSTARRYRPFPLNSPVNGPDAADEADAPDSSTLLHLLEEALDEADALRTQLAAIEPQQRVAEVLSERALREAQAETTAARKEAEAAKGEREKLAIEAGKVPHLQREVRYLTNSRDKARSERDVAVAQLAVCKGQLSTALAQAATSPTSLSPPPSAPVRTPSPPSRPINSFSVTATQVHQLTLERDTLRAQLEAKEAEVERLDMEQTRTAIRMSEEREEWERERRALSGEGGGGEQLRRGVGLASGGWGVSSAPQEAAEGGENGGVTASILPFPPHPAPSVPPSSPSSPFAHTPTAASSSLPSDPNADATADAQAHLDECLLILDDLMKENEAVRRRNEELEKRVGEVEG